MNAPTFPAEFRGPVHVGHRAVYWTGKVCIGLRNGVPGDAPRRLSPVIDHRMSDDAVRLQTLLRKKPRPAPRPEFTPTTRWQRLWAWIKTIFPLR